MKAGLGLLAVVALLTSPAEGASQHIRAHAAGRPAGWIGVSVDVLETREGGSRVAGSVVVADVVAGGPAARAGIRPGDRLIHIGGRTASLESLGNMAAGLAPGDRLELTLERHGSTRMVTVTATPRPEDVLVTLPRDVAGRLEAALSRLDSLGARTAAAPSPPRPPRLMRLVTADSGVIVLAPERSLSGAGAVVHPGPIRLDSARILPAIPGGVWSPAAAESLREAVAAVGRVAWTDSAFFGTATNALLPWIAGQNRVAGAELTPLNAELGAYFSGLRSGLLVTEVVGGTPAAEAGLRPGDVVVAAAGRPMATVEALRKAMAAGSEPTLRLSVMRKGTRLEARLAR